MKKNIKKLSLFIVIVLSLIFAYSSNAYALTKETSYVNINDTQNLEVGDLAFSNILFKDYSSTSTKAFGLTGDIFNSFNDTISYTSTVYYYDSNYNLITQSSNLETVMEENSYFNQMSNLSILGSHNINEITYYRLSIEISDTNVSETNLTPSKNKYYQFPYNSYDYVIDKYDVNIKVNENNTFDITETITAYFNVPKHGIFRTIPLKNKVTRLDGTTSTNRTQIKNVSVDNEYTTSKENGNYILKIGSKNSTLTGEQTYVVKYTYNLGKDPIKNYDELYYNIIGNEWDTVIGNITFTIAMPKEFDSSKLGFSSGRTGSTDNSKIKYNISGNKITGSYNDILNIGEALTIRCELPEAYFVGARLSINITDYLPILIPIIFLMFSILLWHKYGRNVHVIETVEFYPPKGLNSLDVGFLYKGRADDKDVTSLLIFLANKGYLEISNNNIDLKDNKFLIKKLKDYDGTDINEKLFMEGLFKYNRTEVTDEMLYDKFYKTNDKILSNFNNKKSTDKIFENVTFKKILIFLMIITTYYLITIPPMLNFEDISSIIPILLFASAGFLILFITFLKKLDNDVGITSGLGAIIIPSYIVLVVLTQNMIQLIDYIIGIICVMGMLVCVAHFKKRTKYDNEMLGKLKGFKNFLKIAEKDKLEAMVMDNPNYFYDILPFAYVLDVSDKWIKKFESISLQAPTWYDNTNTFDISTFGTFVNSTMSSAESAMSSSPSSYSGGSSGGSSFSSGSSSSGGSSGGGSSGGGSGGGGGGSW
ncbi:MAG: DUF2207 domain-containing protein [bacterium]|nr:DUF2207 domain-containing protein [bacterium]